MQFTNYNISFEDKDTQFHSSFLDLFNFNSESFETPKGLLPKTAENAIDFNLSTLESFTDNDLHCCDIQFFDMKDLIQHYETDHVDDSLASIPEEVDFDDINLQRLANSTPGISEKFLDMKILEQNSNSQATLPLAAPSVKRPRVLSVSTSTKKIKDTTEIADFLEQWMISAPSSEGNQGSQELVLPFENCEFDFSLPQENDLGFFDLDSFQIPSDFLPGRSKTAPPQTSYYPVDSSMRRYSLEGDNGEGRRFKCPQPWCSKIYKNSNGLKYHLEHGNCEFENEDEQSITSPTSVPDEIRVARRPYWCKVNGCTKKYKNLNGLKYHARIEHPEHDFKHDVKGHSEIAF